MRRSALVRVSVFALLAFAAGVVHRQTERLTRYAESPFPLSPTLVYSFARTQLPAFSQSLKGLESAAVPFRVQQGETLSGLFQGMGLDVSEASELVNLVREHVDPRRLRAGEHYSTVFGAEGLVERISLEVTDKGHLHLSRRTGMWSAEWQPYKETTRVRLVKGTLDRGLQESLEDAGGMAALAPRLAQVLQWDLDFHRDLRQGDTFSVLYEEVLRDGSLHGVNRVLAINYENRGRLLKAYRFGEGHYDAQARPLRKLFLRSPLRYSRITSSFSHRRLHPVTKTYRPHFGVDYGAPVGTPVHTTASGLVESAGWTEGGGRTVKVRHNAGYLTAYLHLSRFASGLKRGVRIAQGDTVGYVGSSGLASGPHLDYRIQRHGRWINPVSLPNEPAPPIAETELRSFLVWRDRLQAHLDSGVQPPAVLIVEEPASELSQSGAIAGGF